MKRLRTILRCLFLVVGGYGLLGPVVGALTGWVSPWPEAVLAVRSHGVKGYLLVSASAGAPAEAGGSAIASHHARTTTYIAFPDSFTSGSIYAYSASFKGQEARYSETHRFYGYLVFRLLCCAMFIGGLLSFRREDVNAPSLPPPLPVTPP